MAGGLRQSRGGGFIAEIANRGKREQALGIRARLACQPWDLRQASRRDGNRKAPLSGAVKRADHRAEVDLVGELNFVKQEDDPSLLALRGLTELKEEVCQVTRHGALVGALEIDLQAESLRSR